MHITPAIISAALAALQLVTMAYLIHTHWRIRARLLQEIAACNAMIHTMHGVIAQQAATLLAAGRAPFGEPEARPHLDA